MQELINTLIENPILTLFVVIGLGYLLGAINFFGFRFGIAGVLFMGLAIGALDPKLALPEVISTLGLIIFVYTIGIQSGPSLAVALRTKGYRDSLFTVVMLVFGAGVTLALEYFLSIPSPRAAGLLCGALTSTPALAAARETMREIAVGRNLPPDQVREMVVQPIIAYSIAYPLGVIIVLLTFQFLRRFWGGQTEMVEEAPEILVRDFVVRNPGVIGRTIGEVLRLHRDHGFVVSRIQKHGRTDIAISTTPLEEGDILAVVGDEESLERAQQIFGQPSEAHIEQDRSRLDFRRVFVSSKDVVGKRLRDLDLQNRLTATITRIRRGDVDIVPAPDTRLEFGDLIRVLTHRERFQEVSGFFGDSIRGTAEADFGSVALGMVIGVLAGMVPIPLPGGHTIRLGLAGGPLLVALLLGYLERTGRITWVIPISANLTLRQIGLLLFMSGVGTRAGYDFVNTLRTNGVQLLLAGAVLTFAVTMATMIIGHKVLKMPYDFLMGVMSGIQTQSACVAFAANQSKTDAPNLGYAEVYPAATIAKIVLAQLLISWPVARAAEMPGQPVVAPPPPPVAAKVLRPGISNVASIPPAGGWLFSAGYSAEQPATGGTVTGLTNLYEYSFTNRFSVQVIPTYFASSHGNTGVGDTAVAAKYVFNKESAHVPLFALGYLYKVPLASSRLGLGTGSPDHKVTIYADKNFGRTRLTGNFVARWEGHEKGFVRQFLPSVGVLTPVHGKWGAIMQGFLSSSRMAHYGGLIAAPSYHFTPEVAIYAGAQQGIGHRSPGLSFVAGVTYLLRGPLY